MCVISLTTLLRENTSPSSRVARQSPPSAVAPTGRVTDAQAHAVGLAVYATGVRSRLKAECAECETAAEHSEVDHAADSVHLRSEVSAAHQATHAAPGRHETSSLASGKPQSARKLGECPQPRQEKVESIERLRRHTHRTAALVRTHASPARVPPWPPLDQAPSCRRAFHTHHPKENKRAPLPSESPRIGLIRSAHSLAPALPLPG